MTADERVIEALGGGPKSHREIQRILPSPDPALDAVLRRLKKQGMIKVVNRRWVLSSASVCSACKGRGWTN
jgi:predicted transcriptional regulator